MSHDDLYEAANKALNNVYGDTSVRRSTTKETLETLKNEIDDLLNTLDDEE